MHESTIRRLIGYHRNPGQRPAIGACVRFASSLLAALLATAGAAWAESPFFEVRALDSATSRGVPLVDIEMVNGVRYVTDSDGRAAILEPGLEGRRVFFTVKSHGYEYPADGFGFRGFVADLRPGGRKQIVLRRLNIAERLYRVTGEGVYRESVLLGCPAPVEQPLLAGQVMGQDSVLALPYRGKLYWFWGDTQRPDYPLGQFRVSGATSLPPGRGGLDPAQGVNLSYFVGPDGFSRPMAPMTGNEQGAVWVGGLAVVPDEAGRATLVGGYARMKSLAEKLEQGLVRFDDVKQIFEKAKAIDLKETWRFPNGHPVEVAERGEGYLVFPNPFPTARVRATWMAVQDGAQYEAFTCLAPGARFEKAKSRVERDARGRVAWGWKKGCDPLGQAEEGELIKAGLLKANEAHFQLADAASGKPVRLHSGSFYWNDYLKAYVMIGLEIGGTSMLGEVWFARARSITGPWGKAVKIVTHDRYSFYNPTQHPFFDQAGGRIIYFEGTYADTFSGAPCPTPRYNYNQVMYRLDLADGRLRAAE
ncbi:MAG: DUF4185 domain-containing protein [bacterium]|nr:DUF4185 domain-containing protein [bacterium]